MKKLFIFVVGLLFFNPAFSFVKNQPKLVIVIVIDQFRADYLSRYKTKFIPTGFKKLMTEGAYFPYGEYDILQSMTGPGHATILTGAYPYQMGIPINDWVNKTTGEEEYCVEDPTQKILGLKSSDKKDGRSPKNLIGSTFGDELKNAGYDSKVVSVSLKDRAAILLGGHRADLALWFDYKNKKWVTSSYYISSSSLPPWVESINSKLKPCDLINPCGVEMTFDLATKLITEYKLGHSKHTDLLTISLSSHDIAGHRHGPNSEFMEKLTLAEDSLLSHFLNKVKKAIPGGLSNVVFVLTGDHGVSPASEYLQKNKIESESIDPKKLAEEVNKNLDAKFGKNKNGKWYFEPFDLNFFLNEAHLPTSISKKEVLETTKKFLKTKEFTAHVITAFDVEEKNLPPGQFERQILKTYYAARSGDVIVIPKPFNYEGGKNYTNHMTGYTYDRAVPIIFWGKAFKPGVYASKAEVVDIAPTLSFISGVIPPALSEGKVLSKALR